MQSNGRALCVLPFIVLVAVRPFYPDALKYYSRVVYMLMLQMWKTQHAKGHLSSVQSTSATTAAAAVAADEDSCMNELSRH